MGSAAPLAPVMPCHDPMHGVPKSVLRIPRPIARLTPPLALLATVVESFQWLPAGSSIGSFLSTRSPVQLGGEIFALGLSLALPFMAMLLFVNVALGVVSRVAPQLNLFGVGFPVTITVGIAMLTVGLVHEAVLVADALAICIHNEYTIPLSPTP